MDMLLYLATHSSAIVETEIPELGRLVLGADAQGLTCVHRLGQGADGDRLPASSPLHHSGHDVAMGYISDTLAWLRAYVSHGALPPMPPLHFAGTPFQRSVWQALRYIPAGVTITYGHLAASIGRPRSVRAVAQAVGANPVPFLVPCHRVVGARDLGGYAYGLPLKRLLLSLDQYQAAPGTAAKLL